MTKRKKICVFMGEISLVFQKNACDALLAQCKEKNIDCVIFASCGSYIGPYGRNVFFELGEKNIIYLPELSLYDGVIVFPDTFDVFGMDTELYDLLKRTATCPVISIRNGSSDYPIVAIDNQKVFEDITNHFIYDHGFTNICFMSGPLDMKDGYARYEGFVNAMKKAGLPIKRNNLFEGNYWRNKGVEAVDRFFDCAIEDRPQAIICANDYMAISVLEELANRGIKVPEDVCVSGFDNIPESLNMKPTLTTVNVAPAAFITGAIDSLIKIWNGEEIPDVIPVECEMVFRESCGCGVEKSEIDFAEINKQLNYLDNLIRDHSRMVADYQNSFEFNNTMRVASHYFSLFGGKKGYLCFCDENDPDYKSIENNKVFSDNMILKRIMFESRDDAPEILEKTFPRSEVIPDEYWDKEEPYFLMVFTIHFRSKAYGYIAIEPNAGQWPSLFTTIYLNSLAFAIETGYIESQSLELEEIRKQYLLDPLTGLYNRRGFEKQMQVVLHGTNIDDSSAISLVSIDMDSLKEINDKYGHAEGDFAILTLTKAINECIKSTDFCARMGGDEFLAIIASSSIERHLNFTTNLENALKRLSDDSGKPYKIHASTGVCGPEKIKGIDLFRCLKIADDKMYRNKRKYKTGMDTLL